MVKQILMLCLGNVCRSPLAEGIMREAIKRNGLQEEFKVESKAIKPFHTGQPCDPRVISVLEEHKITYSHKISPLNIKEDFDKYDYILTMDYIEEEDMKVLKPKGSKAKIFLLGHFGIDKKDRFFDDPYYLEGKYSIKAFGKLYELMTKSCQAFLEDAVANNI